jgi:hypothetical protein
MRYELVIGAGLLEVRPALLVGADKGWHLPGCALRSSELVVLRKEAAFESYDGTLVSLLA